jgi:hypothetical protein
MRNPQSFLSIDYRPVPVALDTFERIQEKPPFARKRGARRRVTTISPPITYQYWTITEVTSPASMRFVKIVVPVSIMKK